MIVIFYLTDIFAKLFLIPISKQLVCELMPQNEATNQVSELRVVVAHVSSTE